MVALEAWALGRPVIANAHCDVLLGQCLRSNAGLYYADADEFAAVLDRVLADGTLVDQLGRSGRRFYEQHYSWSVIDRKYLDMFALLSSTAATHRMERMPGWVARRLRSLRPAAQVVDELPTGPAVDVDDRGPDKSALKSQGAIA
jgi:hypothetical protein